MVKMDMARIIAQALFVMDDLPPESNWKVQQLFKMRKEHLVSHLRHAVKILTAAGKWNIFMSDAYGITDDIEQRQLSK